MKDATSTPSFLARCIIGVLDAILLAVIVVIVAWLVRNNHLQIGLILAAFALGLLLVLSVAAWRHGFLWFFSRRAWRFYVWLVVGTISVIVLFYAEENWRGKRAWAALQREVAARGESLELSSVFPPAVPDEENFALAPGVGRLLGFAEPGSGKPRESAPSGVFYHGTGDKWPAATWVLQQATDLAAWQTFFRRHPVTPSTPTNDNLSWLAFPVAPEPQTPAEDVLLALSRYDSALAVLRAANQRPKVRYPLAYEDGLCALVWPQHEPHFDILYSAAHLLSLRAVAELDQGQSEAALQDTLLALRLADSFRQEPFDTLHRLRGRMLRLCLQPVWEGLARHRWNEAQLLTLQQRFAELDLLAEFRVRARGETLVMMNLADQFQAFLEGRGSAAGRELASVEGDDRFAIGLLRIAYPVGWLYQDKAWMYRFYERRADVSKALDPANQAQWPSEMRRATDPVLLILVAPRLKEVFHEGAQGALYLQTFCEEAAVACALERCRLAQGQYPVFLDALVPAWLQQVPTDLLAAGGAPLKYRREADGGFVLYSVGLNRVDDQGKPGSLDKDWRGVQSDSPRLDEGDWVWRQPGRP
jgi:hypothetical protein